MNSSHISLRVCIGLFVVSLVISIALPTQQTLRRNRLRRDLIHDTRELQQLDAHLGELRRRAHNFTPVTHPDHDD